MGLNNRVPKAVRLFLMDGSADGRWTAELSNWTGKAYKIPRSMLSQSKKREDLQKAGIYLLFGRSDELGGKDKIYIGEAENIYDRLKQHASGKDFWFEVIPFISKDDNLNKAHIKYLESRLYQLAQEAGRYTLNTSKPTRSKISEADEAEMEEFLQNIRMLTSILGHKVFENIVTPDVLTEGQGIVFLEARGIKAKGKLTSEGFVVFKGSEAMKEFVPSCPPWVAKFQAKMLEEGVLHEQGEHWVYQKDYLFPTPSCASVVTLGRSSNGWSIWKNKEGRTLKDLEDRQ